MKDPSMTQELIMLGWKFDLLPIAVYQTSVLNVEKGLM